MTTLPVCLSTTVMPTLAMAGHPTMALRTMEQQSAAGVASHISGLVTNTGVTIKSCHYLCDPAAPPRSFMLELEQLVESTVYFPEYENFKIREGLCAGGLICQRIVPVFRPAGSTMLFYIQVGNVAGAGSTPSVRAAWRPPPWRSPSGLLLRYGARCQFSASLYAW